MPVALVEKGTTPEHKVHTTTLTKLPDLVANETIHAPTLIIVGEVVKLTINNTVSVMAGVFIMGSLLLSGMSFSEPNWLWLSFFVGFNLFQSAFTGRIFQNNYKHMVCAVICRSP
jgi:hypothetical protein